MRVRFWRNVTLIALVHVAVLAALLRWAGETRAASAPEITWLSGGAETQAADRDATPEALDAAPSPDETPAPAKSEIVLLNQTPAPIPTATAASTPKKIKPTATPEVTPKKKAAPKTTATPNKKASSKKKEKAEKTPRATAVVDRGSGKKPTEGNAKKSNGGNGGGTSGAGSGKSDAATASYYGNMLHDRFYRAWTQPQTVVASGVKLSAVARIRIEQGGRVSNFKIVKPSGNVLVDESVQSAGNKVTQLDALPAGMGDGGHYDVNINFALNSR